MAQVRTQLLRGGAADLDVLTDDENPDSYTVVQVTEAGDHRLLTGRNGGGQIETVGHMVPGGGIFPATPSGHLSVPPG